MTVEGFEGWFSIDAASGHVLKSVELVGAESIKDKSFKVYDVKLSDVLVSSFENDPSSS